MRVSVHFYWYRLRWPCSGWAACLECTLCLVQCQLGKAKPPYNPTG